MNVHIDTRIVYTVVIYVFPHPCPLPSVPFMLWYPNWTITSTTTATGGGRNHSRTTDSCASSASTPKRGDHGGAGHTHTHTSKIVLQIATSLVCWLQQLLYYSSLCARVSDLHLLSCQDHHFSRDDLDGSDWHRHFWTPHLHGRGHRNLGRPCFPELSGFTMQIQSPN